MGNLENIKFKIFLRNRRFKKFHNYNGKPRGNIFEGNREIYKKY